MYRKSCAKQPTTKGFGQVYRSPKKRRDSCKSSTYVASLGLEDKVHRLKEKLAELQGCTVEGEVVDMGEGNGDDGSFVGFLNDDLSQAQDDCMDKPDTRTSLLPLPRTSIPSKTC